ncbi:hypothetical protein ACN38_g3379 [Penicillium nordicum]|uniref:Uncharacterized protein n=1 Tax=Penicillium nordicum TaxID=229535 RepID=A0A0N0RZG9_9EURO|nr:hypothetical protein ACN38_g3379 [Penicillium nordicum]
MLLSTCSCNLDPESLEKKIEMFICMYCPTRLLSASSILNNDSSSGGHQQGAKRKRSKDRSLPSPVPAPVSQDYRKERDVDIILGLAYYKYVTQILGSLAINY